MLRLRHLLLLTLAAGCDDGSPDQGDQYFDRVILPIFNGSCSQGTSPCHRADPGDPFAFAAGNLDLSSFENVKKRPDVLRTYGAYPVPFLLMKAVGPTEELLIHYRGDEFLPSEIPHNGAGTFQVGSGAYLTLLTWLQNGATRDGLPPPGEPVEGEGACSTSIPSDFDAGAVQPLFDQHRAAFEAVQQVFDARGCNAGTCHGAPQSDFYITCGDGDEQLLFNFGQAWAFVNTPVDDSELLRRPLAVDAGGVTHSGGVHFQSKNDGDWVTLRTFAELVGGRAFGEGDPGKQFFADNVQPILLQRGCAAEGCHSPSAMNDFKLRAGSQGFFSAIALERNYDLARREFMAFESPDVRAGRIVAKNILPTSGGISHRGGFLLESAGSAGSDPSLCPATYDRTFSAFCTFVEWSRIERGAQSNPNGGTTVPIVYVERQADHLAVSPLEFDTYQAGSDLMVTNAPIDAQGRLGAAPAGTSLLGDCGVSTSAADVRGPEVKNDGDTVVFAMRSSAGGQLQLYTTSITSGGCAPVPQQDTGAHNFDPVWSIDGGSTIVYASTSAGGQSRRLNLPQSDLWRLRADGGAAPERVTFLSNSEVSPAFMREGRITMTTEKVDPQDAAGGFYQLSGRRINWDLTDYHPLLAQRAVSPINPSDPGTTMESFGYAQATEIREGLNGNFTMVASNPGARYGAGTLAIFNRSIGPFERGRTDPGFLRAVSFPDEAGVYRSPFLLFDGRILASYAAGASPTGTSFAWDLVAVDPLTGQRDAILSGPGAEVEAVLALRQEARKLYINRRQLVFGGLQDPSDLGHAQVHFLDAPLLATLLGANLRRGRFVDDFRGADQVVFLDAGGSAIGSAGLAGDGSALVRVPAATPLLIGLQSGGGMIFRMTEEHQFGPGERISIGVPAALFDNVCGGCHGSISGRELDITVRPDVLTGASQSMSKDASPTAIGP